MKKILCVLLIIAVILSSFVSCKKNKTSELIYPNHGFAEDKSNSWEQLAEDAETLKIDWYIDSSSFSFSHRIVDILEQKTKIQVNFRQPVTDDGSGLGTLLAGDMLPDLITIVDTTGAMRVKLENAQKVYPLDVLAEKYAPTLKKRIPESEYNYFKSKDGHLYTLSNNFYTDEDVEEYKSQGRQLLSNGNLVARKDYLYAWLKYKYNVEPTDSDFFDKAYIESTTPSGFIDMCSWVKQKYNLTNSNPTVCLDAFSPTSGSNAINRLAEYFSVKPEDSNGNVLIKEDTPEFNEMMVFLNELYNKNLITNGNLSANSSNIGAYISEGLPFVCMVAQQNYITNFTAALLDKNIEYVPIVLTNSNGEAPLLRNLAGYGFRKTLVTNSCKNPDRVIKMIDYLMSEESFKTLWYGEETQNYNVMANPGEIYQNIKYSKGCYGISDSTWEYIQQGTGAAENNYVRIESLFASPMYKRLTTNNPESLYVYKEYVLYNLKAASNEYVTNYSHSDYLLDATSLDYEINISRNNDIQLLWYSNYAKIISAKNKEAVNQLIASIKNTEKSYGGQELFEFKNRSFKQFKNRLKINGCAFEKNIDGYIAPTVKLMGYVSNNVSIPKNVVIKK